MLLTSRPIDRSAPAATKRRADAPIEGPDGAFSCPPPLPLDAGDVAPAARISDPPPAPGAVLLEPARRRAPGGSNPAPWRNRIVGHADVAPGALILNPGNWRLHSRAQWRALEGAIGEVGLVAGVIVNRNNGHVVDGHLRVELGLARGEATVPVTYVELSAEEEALVLATFDPLGAMATADADRLEALLAGLAVDDEALRNMLAELADRSGIARAGLSDPDAVPPVRDPAEAYVRLGDLWELGAHRLLCGDATDPTAVTRVMDGQLAECLWSDPPWGVQVTGKTQERLTIENDNPAGSDAVVAGAFAIAPLTPSARFYVAAPTGQRSLNFRLALREAGWRLHQELVWVKNSIVLGHSDWQLQHESLLYGYVPGPGRPGRGRHAGSKWYGDNAQSSVLTYPKPTANRDHPTQKPVGLVEQCLRNSTAPGDLIYEPFCGSGSTLIAAERLGRRCFAIEIDPRYAQVAIERWQAFTGQRAVRRD